MFLKNTVCIAGDIVGLMKEVPKYEIHDFEKIEVEIQAAINVN
jgi:hypothetical protein